MKALKFRLYGKTAFFKKPDVNILYFTYNNIHKVALLGLLGSIIGLGGYTQQYDWNKASKDEKMEYPEFYEKLRNFKVSIVPLGGERGCFSKKIQYFNNGVGYASREEGCNLIVREQWLENPCWEIYILENSSPEYKKILCNLINARCEFMPYLGKNDHMASIDQVEEVFLGASSEEYIDSLFPTENVELGMFARNDELIYLFKEMSPIALNREYNFYEYTELMLTNLEVNSIVKIKDLYSCGTKSLVFI